MAKHSTANTGKAKRSKRAPPTKSGTFYGVRILEPAVRPDSATVREIRRAVKAVKAARRVTAD